MVNIVDANESRLLSSETLKAQEVLEWYQLESITK